MVTDWRPLRFIDQEILVYFHHTPAFTKKPDPPDRFVWGEDTFQVSEVLARWFDFRRRGRMAKNMKPEHIREAVRRGSWGVGRFYYRVRTQGGRVFVLYYDRAPEKAADRAGHWYLWREMEPQASGGA